MDIEPLWYYIWVCPTCGFASPASQFNKMPERTRVALADKLQAIPLPRTVWYDERRTLDQVFSAYYTALWLLTAVNTSPGRLGNVWLRLLWLYEDIENQEYQTLAAKRAFACLEEAVLDPKMRRSIGEDHKLFLILAELLYRLGRHEEAIRYLRSVATSKETAKGYVRRANDRIYEMRLAIKTAQPN